MPFYAWECLTIQTKTRQVDLIIKDPKAIENLLFYLIYQMKTFDGSAGSSKPLIDGKNF